MLGAGPSGIVHPYCGTQRILRPVERLFQVVGASPWVCRSSNPRDIFTVSCYGLLLHIEQRKISGRVTPFPPTGETSIFWGG